MKALVTGATGFIGSHLCPLLKNKHMTVYGTVRKNSQKKDGIQYHQSNLLKKEDVQHLINTVAPDYIFHLAAQSLVMPSWKNPEETFNTNILSTLHILDAMRQSTKRIRLILFGSSSQYAATIETIKEDFKNEASSPYALSKIVQDSLGYLYAKSYGLDIVRVRPFFIIGPGQQHSVAADFAKSIVAIEKGEKKTVLTGNTASMRDFVDITDAVKAIYLIALKGKSGEAYNLCSGKATAVSEILQVLIQFAKKPINVQIDQTLLRPIDEPIKVGDSTKLRELGWIPEVSLPSSLQKILTYWRKQS